MKVFLDTNIFIRFFTEDSGDSFAKVSAIFEEIEGGTMRPYTSNVVLLEVGYVLSTFYKLEKHISIEYLNKIVQMRNITVVEKTDFKQALKIYAETNVKLADILIALQVPKGVKLATLDKEFNKLKFVEKLEL